MNPCDDGLELYRRMLLIRVFEERVLESFTRGLVFGTTHTAIGQEADGVGVLSCSLPGDVVVSNHRGHGHFLAYGGPMHALAAEMMGRGSGVCGGRGGSQHLHWRDFYASGVLGGTVPLAVGMALAETRDRTARLVIAFLGDGTLGEGVVYESLNLAALWSLPVVCRVENNRYAQTTPIERHLAGDPAAVCRLWHPGAGTGDHGCPGRAQPGAAADRRRPQRGRPPGAHPAHLPLLGPLQGRRHAAIRRRSSATGRTTRCPCTPPASTPRR